jgi:hypothetical protein
MTKAIGALLAAVVLASCSQPEELRVAEGAVAAFREAVQRGAFKEIYAGADPELRGAISEEGFLRLMSGVTGKLGAHVRSELKGQSIEHRPSVTLVILAYQSEFQRELAIERFVFKVANRKATLGSYNIHSPAFQTN